MFYKYVFHNTGSLSIKSLMIIQLPFIKGLILYLSVVSLNIHFHRFLHIPHKNSLTTSVPDTPLPTSSTVRSLLGLPTRSGCQQRVTRFSLLSWSACQTVFMPVNFMSRIVNDIYIIWLTRPDPTVCSRVIRTRGVPLLKEYFAFKIFNRSSSPLVLSR